jgi:hypothetical protein
MGVLTSPDRDTMVEKIVDDLEAFLKRDRDAFWEHVREMERKYLYKMPYKELVGVYEDTIS